MLKVIRKHVCFAKKVDPANNISECQQTDFNIWGIEQYRIHFNDGDHGEKIPLVDKMLYW